MFADGLEAMDYFLILHNVSNIEGLVNVKSPALGTEPGLK